MGRYTKIHSHELSKLSLHNPDEHTSVVLKSCILCGKQAITEAELQLFHMGIGHVRTNICHECFNETSNKIQNPLRQGYLGIRTAVVKPRTGICQKCGLLKVEETAPLHHYLYDDNKYSIELCTKCHPVEDADRRRFDGLIKMLEDGSPLLVEVFGESKISNYDYINLLKFERIQHYQNMIQPPVHSPPKFGNVAKFFDGGSPKAIRQLENKSNCL
jgi:hypothetical protein